MSTLSPLTTSQLCSTYRQILRIAKQWPKDVGNRPEHLRPQNAIPAIAANTYRTPVRTVSTGDETNKKENENTTDYELVVRSAEREVLCLKKMLRDDASRKYPLSDGLLRPQGREDFYEKKVDQVIRSGEQNRPKGKTLFQRMFMKG